MKLRATIIIALTFFLMGGLVLAQKPYKKRGKSKVSKSEKVVPESIPSLRKNEFGKGGKKHRKATERIAKAVIIDSNRTHSDPENYASNLADILGQLDEAALKRVLGSKLNALE